MTGPKEPTLSPPFDPEALAVITARAKRQIRQRMRGLRQATPATTVVVRSTEALARLTELEAYRKAAAIGSYSPMPDRGELDVLPLHAAARTAGKKMYYPFIEAAEEGTRIGFRLVEDVAELEELGRGFAEPPSRAPEAEPGDLDLIVVPALAVDVRGTRLGQGSGFYDRLLPAFRPKAVAVAVVFDFQLLGELPAAEHDARCDVIVTEKRVVAPDV